MKVSDYITKALKAIRIHYVYGCIGGAVTHLVDSISKERDISFVHCYHEQAAAFSASASAKYSGNIKVALATSGPGATNLITGIADAYFDSAPVLFITGQVNTYDFKYQRTVRQYGFQETDIVNIVKPITKYSILLDETEKVEEEITRAVEIALSGRPGPVLVDIPMNIQRGNISPQTLYPNITYVNNSTIIDEKDMEEIYALIVGSKRPLILVGGGCRVAKADKELMVIAEKLSLPVVVSLMGKDCFPHNHPLFAGFIGAYGNRYGNIVLARSDLVVVLGSRLDPRQIGNVHKPFKTKKIIQIDIDENEIGQRLSPKKYIISDVKNFLIQFLDFIETKDAKLQSNSNWLKFVTELKNLFSPLSEPCRANVEDLHYRIMEEISNNLSSNDIICVDVGQNQILAAQVLKIKSGQRFINSGGMAPMGYALPAGIAIAVENKKRTVVIAGDGGMQINIQEFNTVGNFHLPVIIFVFNNKSLGMIKQFQKLYFNGHYCDTDKNCGYHSVNFAQIAKAYGIDSLRIDKNTSDWREKIQRILAPSTKLPLLVQIDLDYQTYIYPKLEYNKPIDKPLPLLTKSEEKKVYNLMKELDINE
ncbi:thiamine pyrophosphate-binding protein [Patescibacteria group bacterium]|nr:thiamine pyrophosphate-binding protein [Patescibacteria group bacterium]